MRGGDAIERLQRLPTGARQELLMVLESDSRVCADVIRQFHERGDIRMVEVLSDLEVDEFVRGQVILPLRHLEG